MIHKAVRCIIHQKEYYLLAIHNNTRPETIGKWGLPGGQIEQGEDFTETVRREMREELKLSLLNWIDVADYPYNGNLQKVLACTYTGNKNLEYNTNEIIQLDWFKFETIKKMHKAQQLHTGFELNAISTYLNLTSP